MFNLPMVNRAPDLVLGASGVRVYSSEFAVVSAPKRKHKKSASMSETYHRRVQKKWLKRFGTEDAPGAFQLSDGSFVMHPTLVDRLRAELAGSGI